MSTLKLAEVDNQAVVTVTDIEKGVKDLVQNWNNIQVKLKDRNLRKEDRENLVTTSKEVVRNILDIVIAGIHIGEVTKDDLGVLRADVDTKQFTNAGHVNRILKDYINEKNVKDADKKLSDIDLAKLMETPYSYTDKENIKQIDMEKFDKNGVYKVQSESEIPEVNDDTVIKITPNDGSEPIIVDKESEVAYIKKDGEVFAKSLKGKAITWFETTKLIAVNIFGLVWNTIYKIAKVVIARILKLAGYVVESSLELASVPVTESKSFWSKMKSLKESVHSNLVSKGYIEENYQAL